MDFFFTSYIPKHLYLTIHCLILLQCTLCKSFTFPNKNRGSLGSGFKYFPQSLTLLKLVYIVYRMACSFLKPSAWHNDWHAVEFQYVVVSVRERVKGLLPEGM